MHLLVVVAEGVRDAQFGNIHQSTLSIPGVAIKKINSWREPEGDQFLSLHIS